MIYAFVSDEAFSPFDAPKIVRFAETKTHNPVGVLTDRLFSYFNQPDSISDPRFTHTANNRLTLNGTIAVGKTWLYYDKKYADSVIDNISALIYQQSDTSLQINARNDARRRLFNVIECIYLSRTTSGMPLTESALNTILVGEASSFSGYVANSLRTSVATTSSSYTNTSSDNTEQAIYTSFTFSFALDTSIVSFKIWLNSDVFMAEYPHTTIVKTVYPCEPMRMLHPMERDASNRTIENLVTYEKIGAVITTSKYKDTQLEASIRTYDHTGMLQYMTDYTHSDLGLTYRMAFAVLYQGAAPTASAMRDAIRDALLAEVLLNTDTPLATEATWLSIFPSLFVEASYYLFPMYFNRINYPNSVVIDRGIVNSTRIYNTVRAILPQMDAATISNQLELLRAPGSGLPIACVPLVDNTGVHISLIHEHPTYQPIDATGSTVGNFGTMTSATQEFNVMLADCIKVALGLVPNGGRYTTNLIDGREYLVFVNKAIEYHLLTQIGAVGVMQMMDNDGAGNEQECVHVTGYTH